MGPVLWHIQTIFSEEETPSFHNFLDFPSLLSLVTDYRKHVFTGFFLAVIVFDCILFIDMPKPYRIQKKKKKNEGTPKNTSIFHPQIY